jgi:hypothetical protein
VDAEPRNKEGEKREKFERLLWMRCEELADSGAILAMKGDLQ